MSNEDVARENAEDRAAESLPESLQKLWPEDTGTLARDSRKALVALLRGPQIEGVKAPELWRAIDRDEAALRQALANMFLEMVIDRRGQIAYVRNVRVDGETLHYTVRSRALTLIQSVILLHLRRVFMSVGEPPVIVGADEVRDAVRPYGKASGLDDSTYDKRFNAGWTEMQRAGIVHRAAEEGRFEVSPVIRLLFGVEEVRRLRAEYERLLDEHGADIAAGADIEAGEAQA
ncbi:DUF4194 domain-containing protein [Brevibacterium sp. 50QC2O2]|jgi:hypothetical protein|uniref:DUF4194 domain-containing protein n=1 Tax=Brevibacterium TaxID=1696 RepID=UPI00211C0A74|nr:MULTISPECIES: DUF4194 domain-containing protein [unclassified Brevibacterium]MCQ9385293.1 DUF4194 domain-containing protein [Brevibacterium sp. 68QC2CO]MCQ9388799.1 DUF4194 domain-containing protein [Brevibacterium sp. 50QC2O2]